ncbi:MAG: putative addiction module antidote protein [Gemmatimonadota bacterium]|nr:putative addiction module antidote protein [Gemmatimonadota bacterium]
MPVTEHKASDYLKTPEDAAAYLNAAIEEMGDDPRLLMKAFRNVAEARGGVSALAREANLDRVALSRALSGRRNPRLDTLAKVSAACGIKLRFSACVNRRTKSRVGRRAEGIDGTRSDD